MQSEAARTRRALFYSKSDFNKDRLTEHNGDIEETNFVESGKLLKFGKQYGTEEPKPDSPETYDATELVEDSNTASSPLSPSKGTRLFTQRRSLTDPTETRDLQGAAAAEAPLDKKKLNAKVRSTSSPALLLSKVKQKIRKQVERNSDWPNSKALALEKFSNATSMSEPIKRKIFTGRLRRINTDSSGRSTPSQVDSIDEVPENTDIVCSSKDLQAILNTYQSKTKSEAGCSKSLAHNSSVESKSSYESAVSEDVFSSPLNEIVLDMPVIEALLCPSAVKDVEFDEKGETWEVYGADFDPEILGNAIQKHLQIKPGTDDFKEAKTKRNAKQSWLKLVRKLKRGSHEGSG